MVAGQEAGASPHREWKEGAGMGRQTEPWLREGDSDTGPEERRLQGWLRQEGPFRRLYGVPNATDHGPLLYISSHHLKKCVCMMCRYRWRSEVDTR